MFNNLQNIFGGCGSEGSCDNLLLFFVLLVAISCFCCGDENGGLLNSLGGCGNGDNLLFFFLILIVLFCSNGNSCKDECSC